MTREQFIRLVSRKINGATIPEIKIILEATEQAVEEVIRNNDRAPLLKCLYVYGVEREPRLMRNPYTGGKVKVGKCTLPKANFTESFKRSLREG